MNHQQRNNKYVVGESLAGFKRDEITKISFWNLVLFCLNFQKFPNNEQRTWAQNRRKGFAKLFGIVRRFFTRKRSNFWIISFKMDFNYVLYISYVLNRHPIPEKCIMCVCVCECMWYVKYIWDCISYRRYIIWNDWKVEGWYESMNSHSKCAMRIQYE